MDARYAIAVVGLALLVTACGDDAGVPAPAPQQEGPVLEVRCGSALLAGGTSPILPVGPLDDDAAAIFEEAVAYAGGEDFIFRQSEWAMVQRTDDELVLFGRAAYETAPDEPRYTYAVFERRDGRWRPNNWGQCRLEVTAPGFGSAAWVVDPDVAPDPSAAQLAVWINERACASGEPPVGREIVPVVVSDADSVTITVLVEPMSSATCPSNPWHPLTVDIPGPLGDRDLYDGSTFPSVRRPWPPSQSSLDSFGTDE